MTHLVIQTHTSLPNLNFIHAKGDKSIARLVFKSPILLKLVRAKHFYEISEFVLFTCKYNPLFAEHKNIVSGIHCTLRNVVICLNLCIILSTIIFITLLLTPLPVPIEYRQFVPVFSGKKDN